MARKPQVNGPNKQGYYYFSFHNHKYTSSNPDALQQQLDCLLNGSYERVKNPTLRQLVSEFLHDKLELTKKSNHDWYERPLVKFVKHCGVHTRIADLRPTMFHHWIKKYFTKSKRGKPLTYNSQLQGHRVVHELFNWAVKNQKVECDPFKDTIKIEGYGESEEYLPTPEEVGKVLKHFKHDENFYDLVRFTGLSGVRPWEARKMCVQDVDLNIGKVTLTKEVTKLYRRVKKRREIFLSNDLRQLLAKHIAKRSKPTDLVFQSPHSTQKDHGWIPSAWQSRFKKAKKHVGFQMTMRSLRPFFITDLLMKGTPPGVVAQIVGHKDMDMVMRIYNKLKTKVQFLQNEVARVTIPEPSGDGEPPIIKIA